MDDILFSMQISDLYLVEISVSKPKRLYRDKLTLSDIWDKKVQASGGHFNQF